MNLPRRNWVHKSDNAWDPENRMSCLLYGSLMFEFLFSDFTVYTDACRILCNRVYLTLRIECNVTHGSVTSIVYDFFSDGAFGILTKISSWSLTPPKSLLSILLAVQTKKWKLAYHVNKTCQVHGATNVVNFTTYPSMSSCQIKSLKINVIWLLQLLHVKKV